MAATRRGRKRKPDFFGVKPEKSLSQIRIDEVLSDAIQKPTSNARLKRRQWGGRSRSMCSHSKTNLEREIEPCIWSLPKIIAALRRRHF